MKIIKKYIFSHPDLYPFDLLQKEGVFFLEFDGDHDVYNKDGIRINTKIVGTNRNEVILTLDFWGIKQRDAAAFCRGVLLSYLKDILNIPFTVWKEPGTSVQDSDYRRVILETHEFKRVQEKIVEVVLRLYEKRGLISVAANHYLTHHCDAEKSDTFNIAKKDSLPQLEVYGSSQWTHEGIFKKLRQKIRLVD